MRNSSFPVNLIEFQEMFPNEDACRKYLMNEKWPFGFKCSRCGHRQAYELKARALYQCRACGRQESLTCGTIMHASKLPLLKWFWGIFLMMSSKGGLSGCELQRKLGLGSYQAAWTMLHKLRQLVCQQSKDKLVGLVEVDETYMGGEREGEMGRKKGKKALVGVAVENRGKKIGRIRLEVLGDAGSESLHGFVERRVEVGSMVHTDGWNGYKGLKDKEYIHWRDVVSGSDKKAVESLHHLHLVVSLLKRWLLGTHQGATANKHLQAYLDEFVFRFNRRKAKEEGYSPGKIVELSVKQKAVPYWRIVGRMAPDIPLATAA